MGVLMRNPSRDSGFGVVAIRITLEIDTLVFERAPQPLDEHVVLPAVATVHRDPDAGGGQRAGKGGPAELAALVRIEDLRSPGARQSLFERRAHTRVYFSIIPRPRVERWPQTFKDRILLDNYYLPGDPERQIRVQCQLCFKHASCELEQNGLRLNPASLHPLSTNNTRLWLSQSSR